MKKAESSLEYLQKLFILPDTTDKFMEFGLAVLEMIYDFFKEKNGLHKKTILRTCDISEVSRLPIPSRSRDGEGRPGPDPGL